MSITASKYIKNGISSNSYIGIYNYKRVVRSKYDENIEIHGIMSVSCNADIDGEKITKFTWDGMIDGFEYCNTTSYNESVKSALKEATRRLKQLISSNDRLREHPLDINFSIFVVTDKGIYIGQLGENDIYLYKKGKIIDIKEMLAKKNAHTAAVVIGRDDLLFASNNGCISKNIQQLIGLPDSESMCSKVLEIGEQINDGDALIFLCNGEEIVRKNKEEILGSIDDAKEDKLEPEETDYIPTERLENKFNSNQKVENDLREFLSKKSSLIAPIFKKTKEFLVGVLSKIKNIFNILWIKVKDIFKRIFEYINSKLYKNRTFKRVSATISQNVRTSKRVDPYNGLKIDGYKHRDFRFKRIKILSIVIIAVLVLVFGVKFTLDQKKAFDIHRQADPILTSIEEYVSDAEGKVNTDTDSTSVLIFKAKDELNKLPDGLGDDDQERREGIDKKILEIEDRMYKRVGLNENDQSIEMYLDAGVSVEQSADIGDIAIYTDNNSNEYLLLSDIKNKSIVRVSLYDKKVIKLPDDNGLLKEPKYLYIGVKGLYVLDMKSGVLLAEFDSNWFKPFKSFTGLSIESIGAESISEFAVLTESDNVYILDKGKKALLKSVNNGSSYNLSYTYISDDSFASANDVLSDLSLYILTSGSSGLKRYIYSYYESKQVLSSLTVTGLSEDFVNLKCGYTRSSLDYGLYLYDSGTKKVFRFEKPKESVTEQLHPNEILLINQFEYRGDRENVWNSVKDISVDTKEEYMYVLDGNVVWKIRL